MSSQSWLMRNSGQPLIQLEGFMMHQRHLGHGWAQGIEQQAKLLPGPQPVAAKRGAEHTVEVHQHLQNDDFGRHPHVHSPLPRLIPALAIARRT